ncbi:PREDICTED: uncharacterized protein LOC102004031 [Chinchilla lanigera]|uniref:Uncharacterized LOC102004031 n=1 Tax=Chinchilla lanigera TaxID=34839 RepID=A0A8C2VBU2_CHILA|nr:PREDICTED: uncharacterized protein LOC102004031 [Chinchilla lanigera]XP_005394787.1 PREDICTED: uncharacterized protein LOC102004031 [Chinchilla lanigera]XP_013374918.1 PREDICTED: uncharacterized protein LOC102004031 [Chinchilla lanigera]XP_013374919.1 PREDICTED: uncharacterized protein LOC102004031 [Chinchilla lanigera]XP_013374920.1 PREDICTED: uncharacterized protein LOC102004031 [Chinchilla lanigera]XP_013374921.1 PREDICTED: uncharacterized protein LOC102004031 [Chinchilla lanigera]XP_01
MSRRPVNHSNTYSHAGHPNYASFPPRVPGWTQGRSLNGVSRGPCARTCNGLDFSTCSSRSEQPLNTASSFTGQPYNPRFAETSHLSRGPKVARKPTDHSSSPHYLLCTDHPPGPSNPSFLDQLIQSIGYLDRSTNAFYNCSQALSLPRLAANYLERAANALYQDTLEHSSHSYSSPSASLAASGSCTTSTCVMPSPRGAEALQCLARSTSIGGQHPPQSQSFSPVLPQMLGTKLPEVPLFGSRFLSHLPKVWEAIRSGWSAPEPSSNPSSWW